MRQTLRTFLFSFLLMAFALFLAGCSSIMRPPPAAAYMDSYKKDKALNSAALSYYAGQLDNGKHEDFSYSHKSHAEWWGDVSFTRFINSGYFTFGWGFQTFTPFLQSGFVSPYIGLTGWTGVYSFTVAPFMKSNEESSLGHYAGGGMLIEQIPLNDKWKIGFTEHISRNGREVYYAYEDSYNIQQIPKSRPRFYTEVGGGFYVSRSINENSKMSLEFRYGRDLDEKRNRIAITLDIWGFSSPIKIGGNDIMRDMAQKNIEKMKHLKTATSDSLQERSAPSNNMPSSKQDLKTKETGSLHTIKRQWIRLADSNQTVSHVFEPIPTVYAVTTKGICYEEESNSVWLKQDYGTTLYQVSADSLDYCQLMERKSLAGFTVLEGLLGTLIAVQITGSFPISLAIGAGVGTGFWALFNFGLNPEELAPKVYPELCSEKHSKEQILNWLKQYPCREKP